MKKNAFAILAAVILVCLGLSALSDSYTGFFSSDPMIESLAYESAGIVEIDFARDVRYDAPVLSVFRLSEDGTERIDEVEARMIESDEDECKFRLFTFEPQTTYGFALTGISVRRTGEAITVSASFTTPAEGAAAISKVEYDHDSRELEVEFIGTVQFEKPVITVIAPDNTQIDGKIVEYERDGIEIRLSQRLKLYDEYTLIVSGVRTDTSAEFETIAHIFTAYDD